MKNKKAQAVQEFLMTYGWAILVAIIVVGVLWYLIGNPTNFEFGDDNLTNQLKDLCNNNNLNLSIEESNFNYMSCVKLNNSIVLERYKIIRNYNNTYLLEKKND